MDRRTYTPMTDNSILVFGVGRNSATFLPQFFSDQMPRRQSANIDCYVRLIYTFMQIVECSKHFIPLNMWSPDALFSVGRAYSTPPDSLAGFMGPLLMEAKGGRVAKGEKKTGEGRGGKREEFCPF